MANYFVGDLQGCYDELSRLLEKVKFDPSQDRLFLVGDLVARGDKSLECLRLVKSLGTQARTVLGNHDLHLLSTAVGLRKRKKRDHVLPIFEAEDFHELIFWLRQQPLLIHLPEENILMSHAGISPNWDLPTALSCAKEVENWLKGEDYVQLLANMYEKSPQHWQPSLQGWARLRYIVNSLTRMRYCKLNNEFDFDCKYPPSLAPQGLVPWFTLNNPLYQETNIIFGHWASLVGTPTPKGIYALDTGCVWGNRLTMLRWEDKQLFTQNALKHYQ